MQPLHSHFGYPSLSAKRAFCWLVDHSRSYSTLKIRDLLLRRCHRSFPPPPPLTKFFVHLKLSLSRTCAAAPLHLTSHISINPSPSPSPTPTFTSSFSSNTSDLQTSPQKSIPFCRIVQATILHHSISPALALLVANNKQETRSVQCDNYILSRSTTAANVPASISNLQLLP
jgi:hypothetical protein